MTNTRQLEAAIDRMARNVALTLHRHVPPDTGIPGNHFAAPGWDGSPGWPHGAQYDGDGKGARYWFRHDGVFGLGDDGAWIHISNVRPVSNPPPREDVGPLEIVRKRPGRAFEETYRNPGPDPLHVDLHFDHRDTWNTSLDIETSIKTGFEARFGGEASPVAGKVWAEMGIAIKTASGLGSEDSVQPGLTDIVVAPHSKRTVTRERFESDAKRHVQIAGRVTGEVRAHDAYRFDWYWSSYEDFLTCFSGGAPRSWSYEGDLGLMLMQTPAPTEWIDDITGGRDVTYDMDLPINGSSYGDTTVGPDEPL